VTSAAPPPLRWLGPRDVAAAMPTIDEQLALAEQTMTALATPGAAQLPSKIAVHPRPPSAFAHAMPAHLRTDRVERDLVGMKWIAGFPTNTSRGLPALNAVVVVNDPETGLPIAILDGGPITARRTAAVSGLVLRQFPPNGSPGHDVALIGAGVQGRAHVPIVGATLPGSTLHLFDRHPDRAATLADEARATPGIAGAVVHDVARAAVEAADVVITAASFTAPERRQVMTLDWLRPGATVVPVDYATYCSAEVARAADLFLVDHREQFLANREAGNFDGYPEPGATIGEAILARAPRPAGLVVAAHLGVGLADLVFAGAIVREAIERSLGTILSR
jgi:alanine dehydrogenase